MPNTPNTEWKGTRQEAFALMEALNRHCGCEKGPTNGRVKTCPPHEMLLSDQRAVDGLLFARRIVGILLREEGFQEDGTLPPSSPERPTSTGPERR